MYLPEVPCLVNWLPNDWWYNLITFLNDVSSFLIDNWDKLLIVGGSVFVTALLASAVFKIFF